MFEPVSRGASQDTFRQHSVVASKFLDSYSMFDWGRMPDGIPNRGKFQSYIQAFIHSKISSVEEWKNFLRSMDALALRKNAPAASHFNELADSFPIKSSDLGIISEANFHSGNFENSKLTSKMIQSGEQCYLLSESFLEEKITSVSVMGKSVLDFSAWKKLNGRKCLPFEFDCEFDGEFPKVTLRCDQNSLSTEITLTEASLITELSAKSLEEVILKAVWIAGFTQYQMKKVSPEQLKKSIRIRMGMNQMDSNVEFVFLGVMISFTEIEAQLQKYYSSTVWGKTVLEIQTQARSKGFADWKRYCSEPAPWLDSELKNSFSNQYQKLILGISTCLSE